MSIDIKTIVGDQTKFDKSNPLYGKHCVFTGALSVKRKDAMQQLADVGGFPEDKITSRTDLLIVGGSLEKATTKILQAQKNGVEVISEDQFKEMLGTELVSGANAAANASATRFSSFDDVADEYEKLGDQEKEDLQNVIYKISFIEKRDRKEYVMAGSSGKALIDAGFLEKIEHDGLYRYSKDFKPYYRDLYSYMIHQDHAHDHHVYDGVKKTWLLAPRYAELAFEDGIYFCYYDDNPVISALAKHGKLRTDVKDLGPDYEPTFSDDPKNSVRYE